MVSSTRSIDSTHTDQISTMRSTTSTIEQHDYIAPPHLAILRKQLRQQRRRINPFLQKQSEVRVLHQLLKFPPFRSSQKIGLYLHAFGEIQTNLIIHACFKLGKTVYLPKICNMNDRLIWVKITQHQFNNQKFTQHRLGMKEPSAGRANHVSHLDLLVMPLLACDLNGTRLGMGGGFYDRTLASTQYRPIRLGIAHDFQLIEKYLVRQPWDQPIHYLITPHQLCHFKH